MALEQAYAATYSTFLFFVVMVIALVFGGGGALTFVEGGIFGTLRWVVSMLPYLLLGYGVVLGFITLQYRFLVPTIIGATAIGWSLLASFIFGKFLPMYVASTSAILTYYTYDYMVQHASENPMKNIMASVLSFLILLAQVLSTKPAAPGTYLFSSSLMNDGLAAVFGVSIGLGGWISTSASNPDLLPYTGHHDDVKTTPSTSTPTTPTPSPTTGAPTS
jgi:hypothetical protein